MLDGNTCPCPIYKSHFHEIIRKKRPHSKRASSPQTKFQRSESGSVTQPQCVRQSPRGTFKITITALRRHKTKGKKQRTKQQQNLHSPRRKLPRNCFIIKTSKTNINLCSHSLSLYLSLAVGVFRILLGIWRKRAPAAINDDDDDDTKMMSAKTIARRRHSDLLAGCFRWVNGCFGPFYARFLACCASLSFALFFLAWETSFQGGLSCSRVALKWTVKTLENLRAMIYEKISTKNAYITDVTFLHI